MEHGTNLPLHPDHIPDATTILACRHFLEKHQLGEKSLTGGSEHLRGEGLLVREGAVVDATIIQAAISTRDRKGERELECTAPARGTSDSLAWRPTLESIKTRVVPPGAKVRDVTMAVDFDFRNWNETASV